MSDESDDSAGDPDYIDEGINEEEEMNEVEQNDTKERKQQRKKLPNISPEQTPQYITAAMLSNYARFEDRKGDVFIGIKQNIYIEEFANKIYNLFETTMRTKSSTIPCSISIALPMMAYQLIFGLFEVPIRYETSNYEVVAKLLPRSVTEEGEQYLKLYVDLARGTKSHTPLKSVMMLSWKR